MENVKQIKLGEIFEVEGKIYAIQIPVSPSTETNLNDGRLIVELITL